MEETQEYYSRPFLINPEMIRQFITTHPAKQKIPSGFKIIPTKIMKWFFPDNQDLPLPQKTYHNRNMPS